MPREGLVSRIPSRQTESLCAAGWEGDVRLPGLAVPLDEKGMDSRVGRTRGSQRVPGEQGGGGGTGANLASGGLGKARQPQDGRLGSSPLLRLAPFLQR